MRILALLCTIAIGCSATELAQSVLKGDAVLVRLSQPVYPPLARQANIYGDVSVTVMVHPDGKTEVAFESGHPILKQAALDSAQESRFECRECASRASYQLVYSFRLIKGNDCCSAMSVPAQAVLEPMSDQNGSRRALITITAEEICLCDPPSRLTKKSRSLKCLYLWKCSQMHAGEKSPLLIEGLAVPSGSMSVIALTTVIFKSEEFARRLQA